MRVIDAVRECALLQHPEGTPMFKISLLVWMMLGTALAGTAVIAVLAVPSLAAQAMNNIPLAVLIGFAAAMPLSYLVARKIGASPVR
jgi:preprotein translocase subunit SecF